MFVFGVVVLFGCSYYWLCVCDCPMCFHLCILMHLISLCEFYIDIVYIGYMLLCVCPSCMYMCVCGCPMCCIFDIVSYVLFLF